MKWNRTGFRVLVPAALALVSQAAAADLLLTLGEQDFTNGSTLTSGGFLTAGSGETGFEAVYRVRVPQGAKISVFHGNFCLSNTDLMVVPVCHSDMTVVLEFSLEQGNAFLPYELADAAGLVCERVVEVAFAAVQGLGDFIHTQIGIAHMLAHIGFDALVEQLGR